MNKIPLTIEKIFDAPVQDVWKALTNAEELSQWFMPLKEFKAEKGFQFALADKYPSACSVTEVIENRKLSYTLSFNAYPAETIVTFLLSEEQGKTKLVLRHEGLEKIPAAGNKDFEIREFYSGWNNNLQIALKNHLEKKLKMIV